MRTRSMRILALISAPLLSFVGCGRSVITSPADNLPPGLAGSPDWPTIGNDDGKMRYSPLDQINKANVSRLQVAWTYHTGELADGGKNIECTPIVVDGVLYLTTANLKLVALDAATGEEKWVFDPFPDGRRGIRFASGGVNRGCAYWSDGVEGGERRILHGTADGRLFSIDARTGVPDPAFGDGGVLDLRAGLDGHYEMVEYGPTSPPAVCGDLVVLGVANGEQAGRAAPGDVRAFDVRTGEERWAFRTIPRPGAFGAETWPADNRTERGGANAWSGVSVDPARRLVFVGLGSASYDFYGGDRHGQNLFANCVVAINADTGERVWHYQTVHHDLWDHDLPTYPNLITVTRDGEAIDAVAQVTKTGYVFVFDRETGEPLFDIEEVPVPASDAAGEQAWPTQPVPTAPPPFAKTTLTRDDLTVRTPEVHAWAIEQFDKARSRPYEPPSEAGSFVMPGFHGGANWSGASFDPATGLLFVNATNIPNLLTLVPNRPGAPFPYRMTGYIQFRAPDGYPAIKPPYGQLTALDLNEGTIAWQVTLGTYPELAKHGLTHTGSESFGGTVVTAGGLVFIGGTADEMFRAFDKDTGELLWEDKLPAGGYATPCTYAVNGRQYVVIAAAGGGKMGTPLGDSFVAYALPQR